MQAFDLEIGQQFCCVDTASQSTENSLPLAGTSAAEKWAPLGRSFPAMVVLFTQHWCSPGSTPTGCSQGSLWGIMHSSKPSEHFGGLRGCAGHGELGRGSPVRRSLPQRETVVVEANKVCSECYGCIPRWQNLVLCWGMKLFRMKGNTGMPILHRALLGSIMFSKWLKRKRHNLLKRFTCASWKMATIILNYVWAHLAFPSKVFKMPKLKYYSD